MSQFRKKPVVIEARQWDGTCTGMIDLMAAFPEMTRVDARYHTGNNTVAFWRIRTREGAMEVSKGDWIIKGVMGEFYPCKPDIFAATYEPAFAPPAPPAPLPGKEYRTGFDEAPSTFNQEDAAPADYPPQSEIEAIAERLGATDPDDSLWRDFAHAAIDADRAQRSGVSADPLPDHRSQSEAPGIARAQQVLRSQGQEPVAFRDWGPIGDGEGWVYTKERRTKTAEPLYTHPAPVAVVPAEQAEDSAMLDWLDKNNARFQMGWRVGIAPAGNASIQSVIQLGGQPLTSIRAAIRAAIGRNREAGGS